ncbi:MAG: patatin-like phospholipase family protein [Rhizobiaceae bacterium]
MLDWASKLTRQEQRDHDASLPSDVSALPPPEIEIPKPGIALALGGGAARGWAHIGVLKALDEAGININMIAGTSIGALVGGCYLAGRLDELEDFARSLTKRRMFGFFDLRFRGNGLLGGMRLDARMQEHLAEVNFDDLSKPFICVATEIGTGHEIWLSSGNLITAMRASYALPGVFEPVTCNGRVLIDGAMVNPVPVSVCRAHEQHLVVAVNLHYDCFGRSAVIKHSAGGDEVVMQENPVIGNGSAANTPDKEMRLGITGVMVEAFNIIQDRITRARLAGDPPDMSLQPKLSHVGLSEFHRADEAIDVGYETTMAQIADLERMQLALG